MERHGTAKYGGFPERLQTGSGRGYLDVGRLQRYVHTIPFFCILVDEKIRTASCGPIGEIDSVSLVCVA